LQLAVCSWQPEQTLAGSQPPEIESLREATKFCIAKRFFIFRLQTANCKLQTNPTNIISH
jgi:hypothetical protein